MRIGEVGWGAMVRDELGRVVVNIGAQWNQHPKAL